MAVVFTQGQVLGRGDLDIYLSNADGNPTNAFSISYAIYYVDPTTTAEVLIGSASRTPVNPTVGSTRSLQVPRAAPGDYHIRWRFRETSTTAEEGAVQEFASYPTPSRPRPTLLRLHDGPDPQDALPDQGQP